MKKNVTFLALFIGLICLPCLLVPFLISVGLGSFMALIIPQFAPIFIVIAVAGFLLWVVIRNRK